MESWTTALAPATATLCLWWFLSRGAGWRGKVRFGGMCVLGLGLWLGLGTMLLDAPLKGRLGALDEKASSGALAARLWLRTMEEPGDVSAWRGLGVILGESGDWGGSAGAWAEAGRLDEGATLKEKVEVRRNLGIALTMESGGVVTSTALAAFEEAAALDGGDEGSRRFIELAREQSARAKGSREEVERAKGSREEREVKEEVEGGEVK